MEGPSCGGREAELLEHALGAGTRVSSGHLGRDGLERVVGTASSRIFHSRDGIAERDEGPLAADEFYIEQVAGAEILYPNDRADGFVAFRKAG